MTSWWRSRSRGQRFVFSVVVVILAVNIVIAALDAVIGSTPGGPTSSAGGTGQDGLAGYVELLSDDGFSVEVVTDELGPDALPTSGTAFIVDPIRLSRTDTAAVRAFVNGGGRLVLAGPSTVEVLNGLAGSDVVVTSERSVQRLQVWAPSTYTGSATELAGDAGQRFDDVENLLPLVGSDDLPVVLTAPVGRGRIVTVVDARVLWNRNLDRADNAAFGLALAGSGRSVVIVDRTDAPAGSGLASFPTPWKWTTLGLVVALLAFLWSVGSRLGPPEPDARALPPARGEHVEAVAASLARYPRSGAPAAESDLPELTDLERQESNP